MKNKKSKSLILDNIMTEVDEQQCRNLEPTSEDINVNKKNN